MRFTIHMKETLQPDPFAVCGAIVLNDALLCWGSWWEVTCKRCLAKKPKGERTRLEQEQIDTLTTELEEAAKDLVAQGKMVVAGKTKDGRNLYRFTDGIAAIVQSAIDKTVEKWMKALPETARMDALEDERDKYKRALLEVYHNPPIVDGRCGFCGAESENDCRTTCPMQDVEAAIVNPTEPKVSLR